MKYRTLGNSDLRVSTVAMGGWSIIGGPNWGPQEEDVSIDAIHAALEAGINLFDTAEAYGGGTSESLLARALGSGRGEVIIASKVADDHLRPEQIIDACNTSLGHLKSDYIDLYQIHWPSRTVPLAESLGAMQKLREQGKIRYIGVSNFGRPRIDELLGLGKLAAGCVSNQLIYSLLTRAIEFEAQPKCVEAGIGILAYSPLAQGLLAGTFSSADEVPIGRARTRHFSKARAQTRHGEEGCERETFAAIARIRQISAEIGPMADVALAWCLHQPGIASVIAGGRSRAQVMQNAAAADLDLTSPQIHSLNDATEPVKKALGPSIDLWEGAASARS